MAIIQNIKDKHEAAAVNETYERLNEINKAKAEGFLAALEITQEHDDDDRK